MSTPHILVHQGLDPGERREIEAPLAPGTYRIRTLEPGPEIEIESGEALPALRLCGESIETGAPCAPGHVRLANDTAFRRTLVIEERAWVRDALTADRATAMQAFRDLFAEQVLRPGDEVAIRRVALMFTDLQGSTALYDRIGDAMAYRLVREHFAHLAAIVRRFDGAIVKTVGDAVMAVFVDPLQALRAAFAIQRMAPIEGVPPLPDGLVVKLGLRQGPCIAVTLNDRLDYFGRTVNMAARLQGESRGADVVVSGAMAAEPGIAELLAPLGPSREHATLKGFAEPVAFLRLVSPPLEAHPAPA